MRVWRAPLLYALASAVGLTAALLSEGAGNWVSWGMLSAPVLACLWYAWR